MNKSIIDTKIERFTRLLFSKVIERLAVVVSKEQLSFSQVAALHIIDRENSINVNDISTRLNLSISATSRMVDELVKNKLLERKEDQKNRRSKIITLTSNGKKFMDNLSIERVKIVEQTTKTITDKVPFSFFKHIKQKESK